MRDRRKTFAWWRWRTGESRHVIHTHPMYTFPGDSCFLPDKDVNLLLLFSCSFVSDSFVTPWVVAPQAPLSMGFSQARMLERVAISFSRGSSRPRDRTRVSCIEDGFFTTEPPGKPIIGYYKILNIISWAIQ